MCFKRKFAGFNPILYREKKKVGLCIPKVEYYIIMTIIIYNYKEFYIVNL